MKKVIAYDLGTGGVKASLHDETGRTLCKAFEEYRTYYPTDSWHEQRPEDWWDAVVSGTKALMGGCDPMDVKCIALSGQSLVAAPVGTGGELLVESVPIWSDTRPQEQAGAFFNKIGENEFYETTGNGFPARAIPFLSLCGLSSTNRAYIRASIECWDQKTI